MTPSRYGVVGKPKVRVVVTCVIIVVVVGTKAETSGMSRTRKEQTASQILRAMFFILGFVKLRESGQGVPDRNGTVFLEGKSGREARVAASTSS